MDTVQVVINLPAQYAEEIILTYAKGRGGYRTEELDGPVGAFAGQMLIEHIMGALRDQKGDEAAAAARQLAIDEVNQHVVITIG